MSFAITLGYLPALLAPIILGGLVQSPEKRCSWTYYSFLFDRYTCISYGFVGLAVLALVAVCMSHMLVKLRAKLIKENKIEG